LLVLSSVRDISGTSGLYQLEEYYPRVRPDREFPAATSERPVVIRERQSTRGFTLVESVIACAVLATALLSIGHLSAMAIARVADARNRTLATTLAVAKLEELRSATAPAAGADVVDSMGQPMQQGSLPSFDRRWSVAPITPEAQILTVVVTPVPADAGREIRMTGGWLSR